MTIRIHLFHSNIRNANNNNNNTNSDNSINNSNRNVNKQFQPSADEKSKDKGNENERKIGTSITTNTRKYNSISSLSSHDNDISMTGVSSINSNLNVNNKHNNIINKTSKVSNRNFGNELIKYKMGKKTFNKYDQSVNHDEDDEDEDESNIHDTINEDSNCKKNDNKRNSDRDGNSNNNIFDNNVSRDNASQSPNEGSYQLQHLEFHSTVPRHMKQLHEYTGVDKGVTPDFEERADSSSNHSLNNESYTQISNARHITDAAANGFNVSKYEEFPTSRVSIRSDNEMFDQTHRQRIIYYAFASRDHQKSERIDLCLLFVRESEAVCMFIGLLNEYDYTLLEKTKNNILLLKIYIHMINNTLMKVLCS